MNPSSRLIRPRPRTACQLCDFILGQPARQRRPLSSALVAEASRPRPRNPNAQQFPRKAASASISSAALNGTAKVMGIGGAPSATKTPAKVGKAQEVVNAILNHDPIPSEETLLGALKVCEIAAESLTGHGSKKTRSKQGNTPTSMLLALDSQPTSASMPVDLLSSLLHKLVQHPSAFITSKVLEEYIKIQTVLRRPSSFPEILYLYANKPVPTPNTSPVQYSNPNPNKPAAAVPSAVANRALDAAINAKDLRLALSIIELTFRQPAYRRALIIRKILPPAIGIALTPGAAYVLASKFAQYQQVVDPAVATQTALAGMLVYMGTVTTMGVVAITTANDQMDRVTWATGMALSERYLREEERAAADRVAQAWGFKDMLRKGEEEGEEWDELREWVGLRGMVLDKVELMEGME